jgi:protease I
MRNLCVLSFVLVIACGGGGAEQEQPSTKEETGGITGSVLMVIAPQNFRDEEFKEPHDLFTTSGIEVTIASTDTAQAKGMLGMVVTPDILLDEVVPDDYDALVIVGGTGCQALWDDTTLHSIVQQFAKEKKTIAAICIAPVVLGRAGILKDMNVTAYPSVKDEIVQCGGVYTGKDVEVSGNVITCSGPKAAADFAREILGTFNK